MKFQPWEQVIAVYDRGHYFHRYTIILREPVGRENKCLIFTEVSGEYLMMGNACTQGQHNGENIPFHKLPYEVQNMTMKHLKESEVTV